MLWLSCEGQVDVWELFSQNSYLSAILGRHGLVVAATVDIRTKKTESFSPQLLQGFWSKLKEKESLRLSCCLRLLPPKTRSRKKSKGNGTVCAWPWQSIKSLTLNISLFWDQNQEEFWWLKKCTIPSEQYHCQWSFLRGKKPKGILHNVLATSHHHLSWYQPRVSMWFQRNGKSEQFLETAYQRERLFQFKRHSIGSMR